MKKTLIELYRNASLGNGFTLHSGPPHFEQKMKASELFDRATCVANGLQSMGIKKGELVGILAPSSPDWEIVQLGILLSGGVCVGIDINYPVETIEQILRKYDVKYLYCDHRNHFATDDIKVISPLQIKNWVIEFKEKKGSFSDPDENDQAILIFSSGTTGEPKGILYTHAQVCSAIEIILQTLPQIRTGDRCICWLPLSNIFQRMINWCAIRVNGQIYFLSSPLEVMTYIKQIEPHVFISVPRFYEKVFENVHKRMGEKFLGGWLLRMALKIGKPQLGTNFLQKILSRFFDRMILSRIRGLFGRNIRFMISGSAPLRPEIFNFFSNLGFELLEAYGTSENVIPIAMNRPGSIRKGSVGQPLIPHSVRISSESEVLINGPGVFSGYLQDSAQRNPSEFYATGDLGEFDKDGYLFLKGRKGDFFKTSTGRRIPADQIQNALKQSQIVDMAAMLGEGKKVPVALISLDFANLSHFLNRPLNQLWDVVGGQLANDVVEKIKQEVGSYIENIAAKQRPAGVLLLARKMSIKEKEITSNVKLRRRFLEEKFAKEIDQLIQSLDESNHKTQFLQVGLSNESGFAPLKSISLSPWVRAWKLVLLVGQVLYIWFKNFLLLKNKEEVYRQIGIVIRDGLGKFKGPLQKVGQVLGYMGHDLPLSIAKSMRELLHDSPPVNPELIRSIVESEFKKPLPLIFAEWSDKPLSTGSVGQVHWAKLHSGEEVVVKVKLPGIERIIKSDFAMLLLLLPLLKLVWRTENIYENYLELKQLINSEQDLIQEAKNQATFYEIFKNDLRVVIPKVYQQYCTKQVMTSEFISGLNFDEFLRKATFQERKNAAEVIYEFSTRSVNRHLIFNGDPHPGNYIFKDNKVVFIDFGLCKQWDPEFMRIYKLQSYYGIRNDLKNFTAMSIQMGIVKKSGKPMDYAGLLAAHRRVSYRPWLYDEEFHFTQEFLLDQLNTIHKVQIAVPGLRVPKELLAMSRLYWGIQSMMVELNVPVNYYRITVPYIEEETPMPPKK